MNNNPFDDAQKVINQKELVYSSTELSKISAIAEGVKQLQDFKNIFAVTDLTTTQIMLFSQARTEGEFWDIPEYSIILKELATMLLSKDRKSRKEIIDALGGMSGKKKFGDRLKEFVKPEGEQ